MGFGLTITLSKTGPKRLGLDQVWASLAHQHPQLLSQLAALHVTQLLMDQSLGMPLPLFLLRGLRLPTFVLSFPRCGLLLPICCLSWFTVSHYLMKRLTLNFTGPNRAHRRSAGEYQPYTYNINVKSLEINNFN